MGRNMKLIVRVVVAVAVLTVAGVAGWIYLVTLLTVLGVSLAFNLAPVSGFKKVMRTSLEIYPPFPLALDHDVQSCRHLRSRRQNPPR